MRLPPIGFALVAAVIGALPQALAETKAARTNTAIKSDALIEITLASVLDYATARSLWGCKYLGYDNKCVYLYYYDRMPPGKRTVIYKVARSVVDDATFLRIEEEVKPMIEMGNMVHIPVTTELAEWLEEHGDLKLLSARDPSPRTESTGGARDTTKSRKPATAKP